MKTKLMMSMVASVVLMMSGCGGGGTTAAPQAIECSGILDSATNLYILDNGSPDIPNWQAANDACSAMSGGACSGWRLPTLAEFQAAYDNHTFDANGTNNLHWTREYWASDVTGSGEHGCFAIDANLSLGCSDNAPISYTCVVDNPNQ